MFLIVMRYMKWCLFMQFCLCSSCLCSWLLQDISCPTCRRTLSADIGLNHHAHNHRNNDNVENSEVVPNENPANENESRGGYRNYFFYLDGQQIANWFPSFSIEVFHGRGEDREREVNDMVYLICSCSGTYLDNPLRANTTKWSKHLSVFDHFVGLAINSTFHTTIWDKIFEKNFRILVKSTLCEYYIHYMDILCTD